MAASALAQHSVSLVLISGAKNAKKPKFRDSTLENLGVSKSLKK
jgi:hypothetical protein